MLAGAAFGFFAAIITAVTSLGGAVWLDNRLSRKEAREFEEPSPVYVVGSRQQRQQHNDT